MTHYNSDEPLSDASFDVETMAGASQATLSPSVKAKIRANYNYRCVICLHYVHTSECAHILDAATAGQQQVFNAVELGILPDTYERNAETNGMVLCPTCHSFFTTNEIVLSLPIPVLEYLLQYVTNTPKADRKPLYEVFDLLMEASLGAAVELPAGDVEPILPYIGLFTLVTLKPAQVTDHCGILTPHLPFVSIISGSMFVEAPFNTLPTAENAARIFHSNIIDNDMPLSHGVIPISPQDPAFMETRYWQLPVPAWAIFAALIEQLHYDSSKCYAIRLARAIRNHLDMQSIGLYFQDDTGLSGGGGPSGGGGSGGGSGPSGGGGPSGGSGPSGGGGPSGSGGRGGSKRKGTGSSPLSGKGKKRARKVLGGSGGTGDCGEHSKTSDFSPKAQSQNGQFRHREITTSSRNMEAPVELIAAGWNDTDSESGRSISDNDKDDPAKWRFGPSFSTNRIVLTATAVNLTL